MSIPVVWWDQCRGSWDHGHLMYIFEKQPKTFIQHNTKNPDLFERAIVIVSGQVPTNPLRAYLETLTSGLVIFVSDEEARWDMEAIVPPHIEIWSQYYRPGMKVKKKLLMGAPNRLKDYKINLTEEKKYHWSFVGQVQNPFRQQCVDTLRKMPDGFLHTTDLFGGVCEKGIEYQEYLDIMCQSRYVICPSGSFTPESFRLYEAMACGAIPIVDARAPVHEKDFNYWNEVYPRHKLISVNFWDEKAMNVILNMPNDNNWWDGYKMQLEQDLIDFANG